MRRAVTALSVLCLLLTGAPAALAQEAVEYTAVLPDFEPLPATTLYRDIDANGAAWAAEVPTNWNGDLIVYAHGFVSPTTTELRVQPPSDSLRAYWVSQGYAWAASSYRANGYGAVGDAVDDTHNLIGYVADRASRTPDRVFVVGASLGGHVTAVSIERYPGAYDGALPVCGVLGDEELFEYFADAGLTASALAGVEVGSPQPPDWFERVVPTAVANLGLAGDTTTAGYRWSRVLEQRSGGERPLFDDAFDFWTSTTAPTALGDDGLPFLLGLYGGALAGGPDPRDPTFTGTEGQVYQYDDDPDLSPAEAELNEDILRYAPQPGAEPYFPVIEGQPSVPVLSLHTIGDLFVPLSMEQVYARRVADNGLSDRFVARAIRALGHCDFAPAELQTAWDDLIGWVTSGVAPAGDDITDETAVRDRSFGCAFTAATRDGLEECPAEPALERLAGADRVATAVALSSAVHDSADEVVLARADLAADALAAAGYVGGTMPLLLTPPDALADEVAAEIARLGATRVTLLGGEQALSTTVARAAADIAGVGTVERVAGQSRYDTASALAAAAAGGLAATGTVYVVNGAGDGTGRSWADAAAASGLTAFLRAPSLLVTGASVPPATREALAALEPERITIVGGEAAVGPDVAAVLGDYAPVDRLAGANRYGTSAAVVGRGLASGAEMSEPVVATGEGVADALVAGPVAAAGGQSLLLVDGTDLSGQQATATLLFEQGPLVSTVRIAGGEQAVTDAVAQQLLSAVAAAGD